MYLLLGVLPARVRLLLVLPAGEGEMVLAGSLHLEGKEKIPPEQEMPEEEKEEELPLFGALFRPSYPWRPSSLAGWTGGHRYLGFWLLPMHWFAAATKRNL